MAGNVVSWSSWISDFKKGSTRVAYLLIAASALTVALEVLFGNNLTFRIIMLLGVIASIGGLVDTTAHLFIAGYTKGLSYSSVYQLLHSFIKLRPHALIMLFISLGAMVYGMIYFSVFYRNISYVISLIVVFIILLRAVILLIDARYYH